MKIRNLNLNLFFQLDKGLTEDPGCVSEDSGHCSPEPESEFLKVHAQLIGKGGTA
jgi:hypothetical protein